MVSKVNLKARIERHSRILKDNLSNIHPFRALYHKFNYNVVLFFVVFLFPVYPLFSSFFYENTEYDFYRGDIDETSILDSYNENNEDKEITTIISNESFLSLNTIIEGGRDMKGYNEVIGYTVQSGDSFSTIANKFGVTTNSILWANNFNTKTILHPGQTIKVPPVSGLVHKVQSGDSVISLAKKYKVPEEKILSQNNLASKNAIIVGQSLIIPGAIKEAPPPPPKPKITPSKQITQVKTNSKTNSKTPPKVSGYAFTSGGNSEFVNDDGGYELTKRKPQWTFYWGNCTRYVAQYKNVNWSGNAKEWLANARKKGHPTGSEPQIGSIVVFNGRGYNPAYGHVGIVTNISGDDIIVKDMNYRKLNEVTVRKVPMNDRAIRGYIYVD